MKHETSGYHLGMQGKATADARSLVPLPIRAHPVVLGIVLFLASEMMFFAALFAAFYDLRANHATWPPPGVHLDIGEAGYGTFLLFAASFVMLFATRAMDRMRLRAAQWYTASAVIAAVGFVLISVHGYLNDIADGLTLASSAYGSIFYAITGFHLLHVIVGIGVLIALLVGMRSPALRANKRAGAEAITYYWHFVFIVWIGIFTTIFVIGK